VVQRYVKGEQAAGRDTSIPRMWEYVKKELPGATRDQAKIELRYLDGPKQRGRPRKKLLPARVGRSKGNGVGRQSNMTLGIPT